MAFGPGKYDDICTKVREETKADSVLVVIHGGLRGSGFSLQSKDLLYLAGLPGTLRALADAIEESGLQA